MSHEVKRRPGINLIGYVTANLGLGVTLRAFARAIVDQGYDVALFDLPAGSGRGGFDIGLQERVVERFEDLPHDINIWVLGADHVPVVASQICASAKLRTAFNVMFLWWELPDIPPLLLKAASAFDALITGSVFVQQTWANNVSRIPVLLASHPLDMPAQTIPDRARFGLPEKKVLFFTGFEAASDPARKNPFASVLAFKQAFADQDGVGLVVKVNNPGVPSAQAQAQLSRLNALIGEDPRIILLTQGYAYPDLLSLYASCDVITSLHRAEGLGLIPLEAMRLGKAVVATGWSGNMSYMNHCNAALVSYSMVRVDESAFHYSAASLGIESTWAEPSVAHAAQWMRALATDDGLRARMSQAASRDSLAYDQRAREVGFIEELLFIRKSHRPRPESDYALIESSITHETWKRRASKRRYALAGRSVLGRVFGQIRGNLRDSFDKHIGWRL